MLSVEHGYRSSHDHDYNCDYDCDLYCYYDCGKPGGLSKAGAVSPAHPMISTTVALWDINRYLCKESSEAKQFGFQGSKTEDLCRISLSL